MIRIALGNKFSTIYPGEYGIEIETESYDSYRIPSSYFWDVPRYETGPQKGEPKPEQSLRNFGVEYCLRAPVHFEQVEDAVNDFQTMMQDMELIKDSYSTSVHVHKNILNETFLTVANLLTLYTLVENILMEYAGEFRKHNLFCLPICDTPVTHKNIKAMFAEGAAQYKYANWFLDMNAVKYGALNLSAIGHYGSVEFRQLSGDPTPERIKNWIGMIQKMTEFSRQSITPPDILEFYKNDGTDFLRDVFGNLSHLLPFVAHEELIVNKKNLWFAGQIAYSLKEDQWRALDILPERKELSAEVLDRAARDCFEIAWAGLTPAKKVYVEDWALANYDYITARVKKMNRMAPPPLAQPDDWGNLFPNANPIPEPRNAVNFAMKPFVEDIGLTDEEIAMLEQEADEMEEHQ